MAALEITASTDEVETIRKILTSRVRLSVTEKRQWLFWVRFTAKGPESVLSDAQREIEEFRAEVWQRIQW